jgi:hypothetical protein
MSKKKRPTNSSYPVLGRWHRHKTLFKGAIIAGVAGVSGSIIYPIAKDYLSSRIPPAVNVYADHILNWEDTIFAEDTGPSEENYRVVTNACLEGYTSRGIFLTTLGNSARATESDKLHGTVYMTVSSDKPILIKKVALEVINFTPVAPNVHHPIYYIQPADGKGGGQVDHVSLDSLIVVPIPRTYDLLKGRQYKLETTDALTFDIPVTFSNPGEYTYHFKVIANSFNSDLEPMQSNPLMVKWLYIKTIDPGAINPPPSGVPEELKDAQFRICS